jgi:antitoxin PrlF
MNATIDVDSTLTDRYQTTVPEPVRRVLRLGKRDKIHYSIQPNGAVLMSRAAQSNGSDPVLDEFLGFLARDMASHPEQIQMLTPDLRSRIHSLVGDVAIDLDAPLSTDDE